ncbi:MAG: tyrosine-type recombinase/integrase [Phenylobacterium sp.]|uniref:tyrosine-type recombinase/integrase n=1 Tax=Phenylobacterium sp. TaxID=1871053 RepID=UPI001A52A4FB|nr:site-specific integrase [Phenylobacterium sp.]MBL8553700.1 tyrosine-type recombinase/integrase [Phenylobacterium sp.]
MPKKVRELAPLEVRALTKSPGMHAVGGVAGLHLLVGKLPEGEPDRAPASSWVLRVMVGGKRRDIGLGGFPDVPLADARRRAREDREAIANGLNPAAERRKAKAALLASAGRLLTFKQAAEDYLAAHEKGWRNPKHRAAWSHTLETFAYPVLGKLACADIETTHVLSVLRPLWGVGDGAPKPRVETGKRLRQRIEAILDSARASGAIKSPWENPARWSGHLDQLLAKPRKLAPIVHRKALPFDAAPAFMARLSAVEGMGARALAFAIYTAARSGEVRGATWAEIDLKAKVWTVPASRTKQGREHRVPLSDAAIELLDNVPRLADSEFVFPAASGKPLSDMTLSAVCKRMAVPAVPHGFRSTFRDWCGERTAFARDVAEAALGHAVGNEVEAAYRRGDALDKRRKLMEAWAAFLSKPLASKSDNVTPMRGAAA